MKNGKRLTVAQRKYLQSLKIIAENWLISKCTPEEWELIHRYTDQVKIVPAP